MTNTHTQRHKGQRSVNSKDETSERTVDLGRVHIAMNKTAVVLKRGGESLPPIRGCPLAHQIFLLSVIGRLGENSHYMLVYVKNCTFEDMTDKYF